MGDTVQRALDDVAGTPGAARRLNIGGMPSAPDALLLVTFAIVMAVEAGSFTTIGVVREATPSSTQWTQPVLASSA